MQFLSQLPLTDQEKQFIVSLGAETPVALYGLVRLAIDAFVECFGSDRTYHLIRYLYPLLSEEDRNMFNTINDTDNALDDYTMIQKQVEKLKGHK